MGKGGGRGKKFRGKNVKKGKKKIDVEDLQHILKLQKAEAKKDRTGFQRGRGRKERVVEGPAAPTEEQMQYVMNQKEEPEVRVSKYDLLLQSLGVGDDSSGSEEEEEEEGEQPFDEDAMMGEMMSEMGTVIETAEDGMSEEEDDDEMEGEDEEGEDEEEGEGEEEEVEMEDGEEEDEFDELQVEPASDEEASDDEEETEVKAMDHIGSFDMELTEQLKKQALNPKLSVQRTIGDCVVKSSAQIGVVPVQDLGLLADAYGADAKLAAKWQEMAGGTELSELENTLFATMNSYTDLLFPKQDHKNGSTIRALYMLHVANHIVKTRNRVTKNCTKITKANMKGPAKMAELEDDESLRDQGFTRPRVVILCPFKSVAYECVKMLEKLLPNVSQTMNQGKFEDEFGAPKEGHGRSNMAAQWTHLFDGNNDDNFRIGVGVSRKAMKLYCPFYSADVLICSPLGLRTLTGIDGDKTREYDFLSSIEMVVVDRADAIRMQNFQHLEDALKSFNRRPREMRDVDIRRLRISTTSGESRFLRQTLVFSDGANADYPGLLRDHIAPERKWKDTNAQIRRLKADLDTDDEIDDVTLVDDSSFEAANVRGQSRFHFEAPGELAAATGMGFARQMFLHCPCPKPKLHHKALYTVFEEKFWPDVGRGLEQLLIVASSYGDFLKIRKYLKDQAVNFCSLHEYSSNQALTVNRIKFGRGQINVMLLTERFIWFRQYRIRGAQHVLFFGTPETSYLYSSVLSWVQNPTGASAVTLFTPFDAHPLERVVGSKRVKTLCKSTPNKLFVYT